jgi:hypothetical protein
LRSVGLDVAAECVLHGHLLGVPPSPCLGQNSMVATG